MKRILALAVGEPMDVLIPPMTDLDKAGVRPYIGGLIDGLAGRGRQLGKDFDIEYRHRWYTDLKSGKAFEAKDQKCDLIYAMSTTVVREAVPFARAIAPVVPIVFPNVSDYGAEDFVKQGSATGFSARRSQTADEGFERFLATIPTLKEVFVLHKKEYDPSDLALALVTATQEKLHKNLKLTVLEIDKHEDIERQFSKLPRRNVQTTAAAGVLVLPVDLFFGAAPTIIELAHGRGLPTFFPVTDWVKPTLPSAFGGYGVPQRKCGERTAEHVDRILWQGQGLVGKLPPVTDATEDDFEWVVSNAAAAGKALNIPLADLGRYPRVI
jgi:ABC-type uncharacterized transport system substrate-binding protein